MKIRRYSEAQIFGILKEVESGVPVVNAAREHGVSPATIHRWKSGCPFQRPLNIISLEILISTIKTSLSIAIDPFQTLLK